MVSQSELKSLGITELKKIAKALGIKGISKLRSGDKDELVKQIYDIQKGGKPREARSRSRSGSPKKAGKSRSRSREHKKQEQEDLACGMENKKCLAAKYKKDDILILAKKCGIDTKIGNKAKTRAQLCAEISAHIRQRDEQAGFAEEKPQQQTDKLCPGGVVTSNLANKTVVEIKDLLKQSNIVSGIPKKKSDLISYLCAVENNKRCEPKNNVDCDGGYTCDTSNTPGICISDKFAGDRIAGDNIEEFIFNGRKIIGTKKAINDLKNYSAKNGPVPEQAEKKKRPPPRQKAAEPEVFEEKRAPPPPAPRPPSPPRAPPPAPKIAAARPLSPPRQVKEKEIVEEDALYAEEEKADEIPVEQTQEYKDIEDILNDIKNDTGERLEDLTNIQKKVLECLGLIG